MQPVFIRCLGKRSRAQSESEFKKIDHQCKCVKALIRFTTIPFHAELFEGRPMDEILKRLTHRLPAHLQPEDEEDEGQKDEE